MSDSETKEFKESCRVLKETWNGAPQVVKVIIILSVYGMIAAFRDLATIMRFLFS